VEISNLALSAVIVCATFYMTRRMEVWLHRHIFKVGWLVLSNSKTTTLIYYTFFLPGIVLNQFVRWLVAGILDVQAKHAIALPETQEIGELKLDFVKIHPKASSLKLAIINIMPFLVGLFVILLIAEHIFDIGTIEKTIREGTEDNFQFIINHTMNIPDFWIWAYLLFTVSNTMTPDFSLIKNYQRNLIIGLAIVGLFVAWGVGQAVIGDIINGPISQIFNLFSTAFIVILVFNLIGVMILAVIENAIETITGKSATFKNGKMEVKTRKEIQEEREKARKKQASARDEKKKQLPAGPPSIYNFQLALPEGPSTESVTGITELILPETAPKLPITPAIQNTPTVIESTADIRFNNSREVINEDVEDDDPDDVIYEDVEP
jgi:hypothetical protein